MKLRSFIDSTSRRIKNKLQTICLSKGEIEWQRVAEVKFAMNKRGSYGTRCGTHLYADDNQIYGLCKPNDSAELQYCLSGCVSDVASWMRSNWLQLNSINRAIL